jgi:hypothetical protein
VEGLAVTALTVEAIRELRAALQGLPLAARVRGALEPMGATRDEVAGTLRAGRIRGLRLQAFGCPVAEWLRRVTADLPPQPPDGAPGPVAALARPRPPGTFAVSALRVMLYPAAAQIPSDVFDMPAPVGAFVRGIDGPDGEPGGRYADLVVPW